MPRTKLTAFSRLLIFLLIFLPLAYIGASYYNGEDPIGKIKGWFGGGGSSQVDPAPATGVEDRTATFENVTEMRGEITDLKRRLSVAEEELARCRAPPPPQEVE